MLSVSVFAWLLMHAVVHLSLPGELSGIGVCSDLEQSVLDIN